MYDQPAIHTDQLFEYATPTCLGVVPWPKRFDFLMGYPPFPMDVHLPPMVGRNFTISWGPRMIQLSWFITFYRHLQKNFGACGSCKDRYTWACIKPFWCYILGDEHPQNPAIFGFTRVPVKFHKRLMCQRLNESSP